MPAYIIRYYLALKKYRGLCAKFSKIAELDADVKAVNTLDGSLRVAIVLKVHKIALKVANSDFYNYNPDASILFVLICFTFLIRPVNFGTLAVFICQCFFIFALTYGHSAILHKVSCVRLSQSG